MRQAHSIAKTPQSAYR